ncbi:MAG: aldolase/citrate lyase family protein [Candidatus Heimdallarchaeaceae archaeon]
MTRRVNKIIELLEKKQPVYYITTWELSFKKGIQMAKTWADYIRINFEHGPFDILALREFMLGLMKGGPTKSGHLTPAIVVELPIDGINETAVRTNSWMIKQILAQGVHGLLLCHAETPEAVKAFVESVRYPFHKIGVGETLGEGRRGYGGQELAAQVWGVSPEEYLKKADVWPLNPNGEIILGIKIENKRALKNAEVSTRVPGICFAEWGPGDMGMSFGYPDNHDPPYPIEMLEARARVKAACEAANIYFLNQVSEDDIIEMINEGVMFCKPTSEKVAEIGRKYTKRSIPW